MGEVLFNYHLYGINGEPEHNTDSILCWCAPTLTPDGVVVHKGLAEIISGAIHRSAQHPRAGDGSPQGFIKIKI